MANSVSAGHNQTAPSSRTEDLLPHPSAVTAVQPSLRLLRSAAQQADNGHHQMAFAAVATAAGCDAPIVRAYAAALLSLWHERGVTRSEPFASGTTSPAQDADAWSSGILDQVRAGTRLDSDDAELLALSVQLVLHDWTERGLTFLSQRIVLLLCTGEFRHRETANVLLSLVVPNLMTLGLEHEAVMAQRKAASLLAHDAVGAERQVAFRS